MARSRLESCSKKQKKKSQITNLYNAKAADYNIILKEFEIATESSFSRIKTNYLNKNINLKADFQIVFNALTAAKKKTEAIYDTQSEMSADEYEENLEYIKISKTQIVKMAVKNDLIRFK